MARRTTGCWTSAGWLGVWLLGCGCGGEPAPPVIPPVLPAAVQQVEETAVEEAARLNVLIVERLQVMHDVALWKWRHDAPIVDASREAAIIAAMCQEGAALSLDAAAIRTFYEAQFAAARALQAADLAHWREDPPAASEIPDLQQEIRPRLDRLNREMLHALAIVWPERQRPTVRKQWKPPADFTVDEAAAYQLAMDWASSR